MPFAFKRAIHLPKRGIGDAALGKTGRSSPQEQLTLLAYCEQLVLGAPLAHLRTSQFQPKRVA